MNEQGKRGNRSALERLRQREARRMVSRGDREEAKLLRAAAA